MTRRTTPPRSGRPSTPTDNRLATISTCRARRRRAAAKIPDRRNDENLAVAQTHVAFMRFHNAVVDTLEDGLNAEERSARRAIWSRGTTSGSSGTTSCPRSVTRRDRGRDRTTAGKAFEIRGVRTATAPCRRCRSSSPSPRSGSGTRCCARTTTGTTAMDDGAATLDVLFALSATSGGLEATGIPSTAVADFRRLYDFGGDGHAGLGSEDDPGFNFAMRIDTSAERTHRSAPRRPVQPARRSAAHRSEARQPRVPRPAARETGGVGDRPADGRFLNALEPETSR